MKKIKLFIISVALALMTLSCLMPISGEKVWAEGESAPLMAIIIDDFGGYEQAGVETMLSIDAPITCAVMPNLDNSKANSEAAFEAGKEVILHMPMQAHVSLPLSWYGPNYICIGDSKEVVKEKIDKARETVAHAKGFNIHIGSGVCQSPETLAHIYDYAKDNDMFFVDSRTHMNTQCANVAKNKNILYLGRDEFLEPAGNKTYEGVTRHLMVGAEMAKTKGYAIVIGHVGSHGGENTARAIRDAIPHLKEMGIKIVSMSELVEHIKIIEGQKKA